MGGAGLDTPAPVRRRSRTEKREIPSGGRRHLSAETSSWGRMANPRATGGDPHPDPQWVTGTAVPDEKEPDRFAFQVSARAGQVRSSRWRCLLRATQQV